MIWPSFGFGYTGPTFWWVWPILYSAQLGGTGPVLGGSCAAVGISGSTWVDIPQLGSCSYYCPVGWCRPSIGWFLLSFGYIRPSNGLIWPSFGTGYTGPDLGQVWPIVMSLIEALRVTMEASGILQLRTCGAGFSEGLRYKIDHINQPVIRRHTSRGC